MPGQLLSREPDSASLAPLLASEREGFEPPETCASAVFKTATFDRSDISPYLEIPIKDRMIPIGDKVVNQYGDD